MKIAQKASFRQYRQFSTSVNHHALKLLEIQTRYSLIKPQQYVLDLGSAPGGWTRLAVKLTNSTKMTPTVVSVDNQDMANVEGSTFIKGDLKDMYTKLQIFKSLPSNRQFDIILSDVEQDIFTNELDTDANIMSELNIAAFRISYKQLKIGGSLLMKSLNGNFEQDRFRFLKHFFQDFQIVEPQKKSNKNEIYYLGRGHKLNQDFIQNKIFFDKIVNKEVDFKNINPNEIPPTLMTKEEFQGIFNKVVDLTQKQSFILNEDILKQMRENKHFKKNIDFDEFEKANQRNIEINPIILKKNLANNIENRPSYIKKMPDSVESLEQEIEVKYKAFEATLNRKLQQKPTFLEEDDILGEDTKEYADLMEAMSKYEPSKEDLAILEEFKNISDKETLVDEDDVVEDELSKEQKEYFLANGLKEGIELPKDLSPDEAISKLKDLNKNNQESMRKLDLLFRENVSKDGFAGVNENEVENWSRESIGKGHFKK